MKIPAAQLRLESEFYVEPNEGEPIPVRLVAPGEWGLVHKVMNLPCLRLDTMERVTVSIHVQDEVELIEEK